MGWPELKWMWVGVVLGLCAEGSTLAGWLKLNGYKWGCLRLLGLGWSILRGLHRQHVAGVGIGSKSGCGSEWSLGSLCRDHLGKS